MGGRTTAFVRTLSVPCWRTEASNISLRSPSPRPPVPCPQSLVQATRITTPLACNLVGNVLGNEMERPGATPGDVVADLKKRLQEANGALTQSMIEGETPCRPHRAVIRKWLFRAACAIAVKLF